MQLHVWLFSLLFPLVDSKSLWVVNGNNGTFRYELKSDGTLGANFTLLPYHEMANCAFAKNDTQWYCVDNIGERPNWGIYRGTWDGKPIDGDKGLLWWPRQKNGLGPQPSGGGFVIAENWLYFYDDNQFATVRYDITQKEVPPKRDDWQNNFTVDNNMDPNWPGAFDITPDNKYLVSYKVLVVTQPYVYIYKVPIDNPNNTVVLARYPDSQTYVAGLVLGKSKAIYAFNAGNQFSSRATPLTSSSKVTKVDFNTGHIRKSWPLPSNMLQCSNFSDIAVDEDAGYIYVTLICVNTGGVYKIDMETNKWEHIGAVGAFAIYVTDN